VAERHDDVLRSAWVVFSTASLASKPGTAAHDPSEQHAAPNIAGDIVLTLGSKLVLGQTKSCTKINLLLGKLGLDLGVRPIPSKLGLVQHRRGTCVHINGSHLLRDTPKAPVVSPGISEQMRAINMDAGASSVLDKPKLAGDGSDTQIPSKLAAASVAATAEVPVVGATACGDSAPVALINLSAQTLVNMYSNQ